MEYTIKEISRHNQITDCWLIAHNKVYDVTNFISTHPIGSEPIIKKAGQDCTEDYDFHPSKSKKIWEKYKIGYVKGYNNNKCLIS